MLRWFGCSNLEREKMAMEKSGIAKDVTEVCSPGFVLCNLYFY